MWSLSLLPVLLYIAAVLGDGGPGSGQFSLTLNVPSNVFVCGSVNITWTVEPDFESFLPVMLSIGYIGSSPGSGSGEITNTAVLGQNMYEWNPIAVDAGIYTLSARALSDQYDISGVSSTISIRVSQIGPSQACLQGGNPSTTPSDPVSSPPATSSNPGAASSQIPPPSSSTPTSSSDNSTNTSLPNPDSTSPTHISSGLKAGLGVVGAVIAVSALAALYWFLMSRRKHQTNHRFSASPPSPSGEAGGGASRWNGLSSVDEYAATGGASVSREHKSFSSGGYPSTTAAVGSHHTDSYAYQNQSHSPVFDEKPSTLIPVYADGLSYPPQDLSPGIAYLPPPVLHDRDSPPRSPIYSSPAVHMNRSESYSSSGSRARSTSSQEFPYPIAGINGVPVPERSKAGPSSSRKPVPFYSEPSTPGDESPTRRQSSLLDPFAGSPPSSEQLHIPNPLHHHELQHKSSFGEKPMQHVLIPDMPPARVSSPPVGF